MGWLAIKKWDLLVGIFCLGLCARFAVVGFGAAAGKSATYDEPLHAASAWVIYNYHDFRVIPEDPPLWKYWASIPNGREALAVDFKSAAWRNMPRDINLYWVWCAQVLYRTPGNDAAGLIERSRMMMVVLGTGLARERAADSPSDDGARGAWRKGVGSRPLAFRGMAIAQFLVAGTMIAQQIGGA
jgi:hypothetical protein